MIEKLLSTAAPVLWLSPFILLALLIKIPRVKGLFGEWLVAFAVKVRLDKAEYHLINNVTLSTEDGTTQIDHIVVSKYGVFVIETKFMKGWIYGTEDQKQWTQKIYKQSFKFQNPLHQNYKHHKTLEVVLNIDPSVIFSVIVFTGDSTFKTPMPANVTQAGGVIRFIQSKTEVLLQASEVLAIVEQIQEGRLTPNWATHKAHVAHVKEIVQNKEAVQNKADTTACPKCGQAMVLRTIKKGENVGQQFWGCSQFPKCRAQRKMA